MALHAFAYVSTAKEGLDVPDLDALLADATAFNRMAGVTGVLMFDGTRFLQYIEGPRDGVASVHARILNARRHGSVAELAAGALQWRWFPRWTMANRMIDAATLDGIVAAPWQGFDNGSPSCSHGFALLLEAWTGGHGELEPAAVCLGS
ncbi:BLUF domain-containing protein [Stenotrophomonas sp. 9(2022)]|uniref:BLUF domain-containing protein n=1 Tax=Stenotrophomonas sp. 9(2022) TaxID=2950153 RepID=UPI00211452B2|nr:BLUF domain-containing protein [Stenotrophomonas sp. 9(2022)]